jgi:prefoldin subunit 5
MSEQQKHLQQLIEQSNQLANDINALNNQLTTKRELFLKVQGVIEYLEQTGTTLPEPEKKEEESEEPKEEA